MAGYSLRVWVSSLGMLAGTWGVVLLALASLLPPGDGTPIRLGATAEPQQHAYRSYPLWVTRRLPCTHDDVTLDLSLVLDSTWRVDGDFVDFEVLATLTSSPSEQAPFDVHPTSARVAFSSPRYGKTGHVHELQAPILGQPSGVVLVVGIQLGMDAAGDLFVQPGMVRVTCP